MKKIFILLFIIILGFFTQSCSRLDVAVTLANTYVTNKADDYFDLTMEQKKWFKVNFDKNFNQVRKFIIPLLASELMRAADTVSAKQSIDAIIVSNSYERVKNLFYAGLRIFSTDAVAFADQLNPAQVAFFQKEFNKKMVDVKEVESSKNSYKRIKNQFDSWLGMMESSQKAEVEKFTQSNPPVTNEKIKIRKLLAMEFVGAYPDKVQRKDFVEKLFTQYESMYEAKFSKEAKDRNNKMIDLVASVLNKMSNDQRNTLVETLKEKATQLMKISKS